ncbi:hypothetical protein MJ561_13735 [Klebsiella pneumoniae]|nr:hypothetical protein MJ561_13735 [Klebsiella pneumoniae]
MRSTNITRRVRLRFVQPLTTDGAQGWPFNERISPAKMTLDKLAISVEKAKSCSGADRRHGAGRRLDADQDGKGVNSQMNYTVNSLKLPGAGYGQRQTHAGG